MECVWTMTRRDVTPHLMGTPLTGIAQRAAANDSSSSSDDDDDAGRHVGSRHDGIKRGKH